VVPDPQRFSELIEKGYDDKYVPVALQLSNNDVVNAIGLIGMMKARVAELTFTSSASESRVISPMTATLESVSDESCWEVVDVKCPVCKDSSVAKSEQIISCASCSRIYHTFCVGLRRIPFSNATEKDRTSREKYIRRHLSDWKCAPCLAQADTASAAAGSESLVGKSMKMSSFAMSQPTSRQSFSVCTGGGGVVVTDKLHPMTNPTGQPLEGFVIGAPAIKPVTSNTAKWSSMQSSSNGSSEGIMSPRCPVSPIIKSKQDHVAALVVLLSSAGVGIEDLMHMPEEKQRETILKVISTKHPEFSLDGLQSHSLNLATALKGILQQLQQQGLDTKTANVDKHRLTSLDNLLSSPSRYFGKSLISEARVDDQTANSKASATGAGEEKPFDPRAHMLQVIQRRANMTTSMAKDDKKAGQQDGSQQSQSQNSGACQGNGSGVAPPSGLVITKQFAITPVRDLPQFAKYYKMVKAGIPKHAVAQKLLSDKVVDSEAMAEYLMSINLDEVMPEEYYTRFNIKLAVSTHPKYEKFFKMVSVGIAKEAVKAKMCAEGLDPAMLDLSPDRLIAYVDSSKKSSEPNTEEMSAGPGKMVPVGEHPRYKKFFTMIKVGLPKEAIKLKMQQESIDPSILDKQAAELVPERNVSSKETAASSSEEMVAVAEHPRYSKYFKMLKMGLPSGAVQLKMQQEGVDASILDKAPTDKVPLQETSKQDQVMIPLADHPKYSQFFKMLQQGMPLAAVKAKAQELGLNPNTLEKDPNELVAVKEDEVPKVAAVDHPLYGKYFKMLKISLPLDAVKAKVQQEGLNPSIMDKEPSELIPLQMVIAKDSADGSKSSQQLKVRKKKLYWKALDASKLIQGNSLWADENDVDLQFDEEEFKQLFVESLGAQAAKPFASRPKEVKKQKIVLIDRKRAQNAGIALARIRFSPEDLKAKIMKMDDENVSADQLRSMIEFLPTPEEMGILRGYQGDVELLGQAERYMLVMLGFSSAAKRILCMIYKQQFKPRFMECRAKIAKVQNACDDVKLSTRLRKVLKAILKVGNQLNDGEDHKGFTVDSLLKLQSAKAFDKKTSVLQYVITLIYRNDEDCLRFPEDLKHVSEAARMSMDTINSEKNNLIEEFHGNLRILEEIRATEDNGNTDAMLDFLVKADGLCKELVRGIDKAKEKFARVLEYFGEDPSMSSQEFFSTLFKFLQVLTSLATCPLC
jgi:hypothetical protein